MIPARYSLAAAPKMISAKRLPESAMVGEWPSVPLGELAAEREGAIAIGPFGSAMRAETYADDGVRVIRGTNISDTRAWKGDWVFVPDTFAAAMPRCIAATDDLVFPHRGAIGEVAIVPTDDQRRYFLSTSLMKITLDDRRANPLFVYYYFRSGAGKSEILRFASQVGTPGIGQPLSSLKQFRVPLPPLHDQSAIADLLAGLDDKIELNRRMAETLEGMARALFRSWFVDFDPVRAKEEGRPTGLPDDLAALFPDRFGEDGMPAGWSSTAGSIGGLARATVEPREVEPETPYLGLEHFDQRHLLIHRWGQAAEVDSVKMRFAVGDLLFGKLRPYFHKVAIAPFSGICSSDIFVFRPVGRIPATFLYLAFSEDSFVNAASTASHGTKMPRADWGFMRQQAAALPPAALLGAFDSVVAPMIASMLARSEESQTLAALRDTLLPKLISGELRIADAEKQVAVAG